MTRASLICAVFLAGAAFPAHAAPAWSLVQGESKLTLSGELSGQPTEVDLTGLSGDIAFDPGDLPGSRIKIVIDLGKIAAGYDALVEVLTSAAWFDAPKFPTAVFTSQSITKRPDGRYAADGALSLKGVTKPVTVVFSYKNEGPAQGKSATMRATAKGEAMIDRAAFTIGTDDWGKSVANNVRVTFTVVGERPSAP
jgi:polyisoprenoid-binding protein YceI